MTSGFPGVASVPLAFPTGLNPVSAMSAAAVQQPFVNGGLGGVPGVQPVPRVPVVPQQQPAPREPGRSRCCRQGASSGSSGPSLPGGTAGVCGASATPCDRSDHGDAGGVVASSSTKTLGLRTTVVRSLSNLSTRRRMAKPATASSGHSASGVTAYELLCC